jgi:hypothetical protein
MAKKSCCPIIAFCALLTCGSLIAQEAAPQIANADVINMLRAQVPESTIVSELNILVGQGATFNISPSAMVDLQRAGASEKVLNAILYLQTDVVPGLMIVVPKGVFYRTGATATELRSFLLWPEFVPRWETWPFYPTGAKNVAMNASPAVVQVADSTPTLLVQGFTADSGWQLVRIARAADRREVKLKRKSAFSRDFFSDSTFEQSELRPLTIAAAGSGTFTVRPASALEPGNYALCSQLEQAWMRACYEFQVTTM